jgi:hypothetical protein
MIDAESNLRGGMAEMDGHSEQNDTMKKQGENGHDH